MICGSKLSLCHYQRDTGLAQVSAIHWSRASISETLVSRKYQYKFTTYKSTLRTETHLHACTIVRDSETLVEELRVVRLFRAPKFHAEHDVVIACEIALSEPFLRRFLLQCPTCFAFINRCNRYIYIYTVRQMLR